jgi:hypothetical protein
LHASCGDGWLVIESGDAACLAICDELGEGGVSYGGYRQVEFVDHVKESFGEVISEVGVADHARDRHPASEDAIDHMIAHINRTEAVICEAHIRLLPVGPRDSRAVVEALDRRQARKGAVGEEPCPQSTAGPHLVDESATDTFNKVSHLRAPIVTRRAR